MSKRFPQVFIVSSPHFQMRVRFYVVEFSVLILLLSWVCYCRVFKDTTLFVQSRSAPSSAFFTKQRANLDYLIIPWRVARYITIVFGPYIMLQTNNKFKKISVFFLKNGWLCLFSFKHLCLGSSISLKLVHTPLSFWVIAKQRKAL